MNHSRILVVEDQQALRLALKNTLAKAGFAIDEADNGFAGLRQAITTHPDLILLDIMMPEMDGMRMLKELRQDDWGKTARVILLTNILDDEETLDQARELGVGTYLLKAEWSLQEVVNKVHQELKIPA